ncbi:helix-turn-helix domain-containing protein [Streptomyces sp. A0592]|uniref:helix-turn-helix domain-containing protein n=1 Tax=Streptomyces sp. A0592 TaxID=2563099 RepID=UPI00109EA055|nr:helix-turn-helix domain-containing protein [Streptomyces sp. A0592]THA77820.1 hypothetical protein E6U81_34200 [Streptomyces sp. A0592]
MDLSEHADAPTAVDRGVELVAEAARIPGHEAPIQAAFTNAVANVLHAATADHHDATAILHRALTYTRTTQRPAPVNGLDDTAFAGAIPTLPSAGPHPSDLLTDKEAGALLGIDPSTVRAYASTGYLPKGTDRHGRTWWPRHAVEARRDAGDRRHHNPGQRPGDPRNRAPRPRHDPRIAEIAELTRRSPLTTSEIVHRYAVSTRTAQRLLAAARQHATG